MAHRDSLQDCYLVPDLRRRISCEPFVGDGTSTYHVFAAGHQSLINNFCSIVSACVDMYALLHYRVRACAKCLASLISACLDLRRPLLLAMLVGWEGHGCAWRRACFSSLRGKELETTLLAIVIDYCARSGAEATLLVRIKIVPGVVERSEPLVSWVE